DQREAVKELTEQLLAQSGRNGEALALLAGAYGKESNFDKAMELAREAWDRKARSSSRGYGRRYFSYYGMYGGGYQGPDDLLGQLYRYAQGAGKSADLIKEFEDRLAKQPGSIELHRNLASLYQMNDEVDQAMAVWADLEQKRPNLAEAKMARARVLEERGRFQDAIAVYEALMKSNPSVYTSMSWHVRSLYQRAGQGEKLKSLEDDLVAKATNPDQLQDIAWQFRNDGDFDKALDLFARVLKAAPERTWAHTQLAETYVEMGRYDDAATSYADWLNSPLTRSSGWVDYYALNNMVALYRALGRLPELKAQADATLAKDPTDRMSRGLATEVAMYEKRFGDARALLEESMSKYGDQGANNAMVEILSFETNVEELTKTLEAGQRQGWYGDFEQLGQLYMAAGKPDKAYEVWQNLGSYYGGSWGILRGVQHLMYYGLYDKAEDYFVKNRGAFQNWEAEEVSNAVVRAYFYGQGFAKYIDRLKAEKVRGGDQRFVENLFGNNAIALQWKRDLLAALLANEPDSKELLELQAQLLEQTDDTVALIPVLESLCAKDDTNGDYRNRLANALRRAGREDEAVAMFTAWAQQRFALERVRPLAEFLEQSRPRDLLALRDMALEKVDPSQRDDVRREAASFEANFGNIEAARAALLDQFEQRKDAGAFNNYFQFLTGRGRYKEAHEFLLQHKDDGFIDQWSDSARLATAVCVQQDDLDLLTELAWRFTRFSDRWN
ncbi:MAG: tetratricopeptide repeat protein, partial [Candidatus Hydrogenedentes bacterium]|nr:tetratricopeptide repeat protein [Candidatus Hydrogenedentota bacterium]